MKVLLTGGGTGGSTTPLLAIADELRAQHLINNDEDFLWLGTRFGPERLLVEGSGMRFVAIFSGKWRRYFSFKNIIDPVFIFLGFCQALYHILTFKPDVILSAGGFISVPVIWAAWILHKKILIHQQDIKKGLANKLMAPFAKKITVSFEKSLKEFSIKKTVWTGNAVRASLFAGDTNRARDFFKLEDGIPTVLFTGGGTGAHNLNMLIGEAAVGLTKFCQIIHLTGRGKKVVSSAGARYHQYEFLGPEMKDALAVADLVVSRAGLSTLSELSALGKAAIIIPLPGTHQEENAYFFKNQNAVLLVQEKDLSSEGLIQAIKEVLNDDVLLESLADNIKTVMKTQGRENIVSEIVKLIK